MNTTKFRLVLILAAIVVVLAVYFALSGPKEQKSAAPPAGQTPAAATSGDYADDWMKQCGPIQEPSRQKDCTARLDKAYGRSEGAPVPPPGKETRP